MALDFTLERQLFVHSIENPPAIDLACYITLNLKNSKGVIDLLKYGGGDQTEYLLHLESLTQIGFASAGQGNLDSEFTNLVLAMNLALSASCLMQRKLEFVDSTLKLKPMPPKPPTVTDDDHDHFTVNAESDVYVSDHASFAFGLQEDIDEPTVIKNFKRLQRARSTDITSTSHNTESNLAKALDAYELAMKSPDRLDIFKNLYSTVELSANFDGSPAKGAPLDTKISVLAGVPATDAENWRDLNNRTKHADQSVNDIETYVRLVAELPTMNRKVRDCARTLLLLRLP